MLTVSLLGKSLPEGGFGELPIPKPNAAIRAGEVR